MSDSTENAKERNAVTQYNGFSQAHCAYQFSKEGRTPFGEEIWQCPICRTLYEYDAWARTWKRIF